MMLFISKLLPIFIFPLGLSLLLLGASMAGALLSFRRLKIFAFAGAVVILWASSTPLVADWAASSLERQYPAKPMAETQTAEVAIVLGGAVRQPSPPRVEPGLSAASDRVLHAARLYKAGKVKRVLVAAGNIPWLSSVKPEAELIGDLLMEWGVPSEAIELGSRSRNTYENALEIKEIWQRHRFESALLVTSAAHMPRAMATFLHAGLPVAASTADVHITGGANPFALLPDPGALETATNAMKEWLGLLVYRLRGWA
jgi:uncharacterized SAM-binding protein YcdF (DUF218 family)